MAVTLARRTVIVIEEPQKRTHSVEAARWGRSSQSAIPWSTSEAGQLNRFLDIVEREEADPATAATSTGHPSYRNSAKADQHRSPHITGAPRPRSLEYRRSLSVSLEHSDSGLLRTRATMLR
jgi:hypothetical protein